MVCVKGSWGGGGRGKGKGEGVGWTVESEGMRVRVGVVWFFSSFLPLLVNIDKSKKNLNVTCQSIALFVLNINTLSFFMLNVNILYFVVGYEFYVFFVDLILSDK